MLEALVNLQIIFRQNVQQNSFRLIAKHSSDWPDLNLIWALDWAAYLHELNEAVRSQEQDSSCNLFHSGPLLISGRALEWDYLKWAGACFLSTSGIKQLLAAGCHLGTRKIRATNNVDRSCSGLPFLGLWFKHSSAARPWLFHRPQQTAVLGDCLVCLYISQMYTQSEIRRQSLKH